MSYSFILFSMEAIFFKRDYSIYITPGILVSDNSFLISHFPAILWFWYLLSN